MNENTERRTEQRLRYHWPVWYAEDFDEMLTQGQMVDVSSGGAAFTCYQNQACPFPGQHLTARFSVPQFESGSSFGMASFTRDCKVCRVENVNGYMNRIAVQFAEPLPFKPGEQADSETEEQEKLMSVTI